GIEKIAFIPDVVVDHVEKDRDASEVTGVHQPPQSLGSPVRMLHCILKNSVISPVARTGKLRYRHQLKGCDPRRRQLVQSRDDGVEISLRCKSADMQLIKDQLAERASFPGEVGPFEASV